MKGTPPTVLIVDDDATLRRALASVLDSLGYRVLSAGNPDTAYELAAAVPPDAVLLDVRLPSMSGLALYLAILHRWPALGGRIAIMTGDADAADVRPWLEAHDCPVFRKPFRFESLTGWLDVAVRTGNQHAAEG
jgi:two-component system, OmpR family, KDP operon response regulator KdpE